MTQVHDLKCHPGPFAALWDWRKTGEFRRFDRAFKRDDILLLQEYDDETERYTGREMQAWITDVTDLTPYGAAGYCLLSFERPERTA